MCHIGRSKKERENICMWSAMWHIFIDQYYLTLISQCYIIGVQTNGRVSMRPSFLVTLKTKTSLSS